MPEVSVSKSSASKPLPPARTESVFDPFHPWSLSPFAVMREFSHAMDHLMQSGNGSPTASQQSDWAPAVDIQRCDGSLVISAEVPGMKKEDVKVDITDDALVLQGERKQEHTEDHEGFHRYERSFGRFYRSIALPEGAEAEKAKAELKDGVLRVTMPVTQTEKPKTRRVQVTA